MKERRNASVWPWAVPAAGLVVFVWAYWARVAHALNLAIGTSFRGSYDEPLALFAALAFIGVLFAILSSRQRLKSPVEDIEETLPAPSSQAPPVAEPSHALKHERFESTLFELMMLHRNIVASTRKADIIGTAAFNKYVDGFKASLKENSFDAAWKIYETHLGHYVRTLDTMLMLIAENSPDPALHYNIVRSILSDNEKYLIARAAEFGSEEFKSRVLEGGILMKET